MSRFKWWILIVILTGTIACYFLFFKTFSEKTVSADADHIISLDVKRITNTVIWNYLTTPELWKSDKQLPKPKKTDWSDIVRLPDYIFIFHVKNQPVNAWYTVFEIKNEEDFNKGLSEFGFTKIGNKPLFISKQMGLAVMRYANKILVGNEVLENKELIEETANKLFLEQKYIERQKLKQHTEIPKHLVWNFKGDHFFETITGQAELDKEKISASINIILSQPINFEPVVFNKPVDFMASLGMTQPPDTLYNLINDSIRQTASRWLNFNIDSLFLPDNRFYQTNVNSLITRVDTAISYVFDEDFNQVEKKVLNQVVEPAFNFTLKGIGATSLYNYWNTIGILQNTNEGNLFTAMPLVKTYCTLKEKDALSLVAENFRNTPKTTATDSCLFYAYIDFERIPEMLLKYLPNEVLPFLQKIATVNLTLKNEGDKKMNIDLTIEKQYGKTWFSN